MGALTEIVSAIHAQALPSQPAGGRQTGDGTHLLLVYPSAACLPLANIRRNWRNNCIQGLATIITNGSAEKSAEPTASKFAGA